MTTSSENLRVLCIDYSVGFGGATKSSGLMFSEMSDVSPVIITSQTPDVRRLWYGAWRTHRFRRLCNYRTRWVFESWLTRSRLPRWAQFLAMKAYALWDAITAIGGVLQIAILARLYRVHLVHFATGFGPPEATVAGKLAGVPSIVHLRGFLDGRCPRFPSSAAPSLVIGDSRAVTDSFISACGAAIPSTTLYEVVDVDRVYAAAESRDTVRRDLGLSSEHVAVALFGRIVKWKGQREFVLAMLTAMESNPDLVGVLVGDASDGGDAYHDEIKSLIQHSGVEGRFRLTGYVEEVEPIYAATDVVVHASIEPEPCGMVVMEGMAAGKPVIAADAGGPRELIRDGVDGYLTKPGCPTSIAEAVLKLADAPALRRSMGASGHDRARRLFDTTVGSNRLRSIYERLVAGANPSASLSDRSSSNSHLAGESNWDSGSTRQIR